MLSDKRNSIAAKAICLIFLLFDVARFIDVPFGTLQYVQYILHGLTRAHSSLLTTKGVNFVVGFNESSVIFIDLDLAIHYKYSLPSNFEPIENLQHHLYSKPEKQR